MKITFYNLNNDSDVIHCYNNQNSQEFLVKPNRGIVKILNNKGGIIEYPLVTKKYTLIHEIELDVEELHVEFWVLGDKK